MRPVVALELGEHGTPAPQPNQVRVEIQALIPDLLRAVTLYGLGAVYFTCSPPDGAARRRASACSACASPASTATR